MTNRQFIQSALILGLSALAPTVSPAQSTGATFGTVITLGATPSDAVLDESRNLIYLVNQPASRVDLLSTASNAVIASINVGAGPLAAAMSMDNRYLYVSNGAALSVSVIDLNSRVVAQTVTLPAAPQGVAVGADGLALIATVGSTTTSNSLYLYDQTQAAGSATQLVAINTPPTPTTPSPLPGQTLAKPDVTFTGRLIRTPNGQYIIGLTVPSTTVTDLFVYEVASHSILRSRNVNGQSTVLSMSPDGSRFMAGYTLYDVATLSILGQMNVANATFPVGAASTTTFSTRQNIGGSVFSSDGKTIYGAFNVAPFTTPLPPSNSSTLLVTDSSNLGIQLGIKLPESIVSKMMMTADGTNAWSLSQSGLIYLPLSKLYTYPILMPSSTQVFLSQNPCNPGLAQGTVRMNNLGAGTLTFSIATISSFLTTSLTTGVAPSTVTFTMEPGRLGEIRQAGTNLATLGTATTLQGQALDVTLASPNAINVAPVVRVYMNYRQADQRGVIFPVPVTQNNSPNANLINTTTSLIDGDQGLEDIVLDQPRNRVYITNAGLNRVEVFDIVNQVFLNPIKVGQLPHQMALSTDGNTLYVANTGGELIDIIDLTINNDVGHIAFPPIPRQAAGQTAALLYPQAMALGNAGLQFVMSNGTQWHVVQGNAVPRPADTITATASGTNVLTTPVSMLASPDYTRILTLAGTNSGTGYLYDAASDAYIASASLFPAPVQSFFGPLSAGPAQSWYALGGLYTNNSLSVLGGVANPSSSTGAQRNVVATAPFDQSSFVRLSTPVKTNITTTPTSDARPILELVNINTGSSTLLAVAPENPRFTLFGTAKFNIPPRSMAIDNNNVAYIITLSGLSVVPLTPNGVTVPQIASNARAVVSASDGSANLVVGGVVNINGTNLATSSTANTLPPPTVLGGSCVIFNDVPLPLLQTSSGQIQAQIPPTVTPGTNVVQVRSLALGQQSNTVVVTVKAPTGTGNSTNSGSPSVQAGRSSNRVSAQ